MSVNTVDFIITNALSFEQRIQIKAEGRDCPQFTFLSKRQCRLHEQYTKWTWMTGCPIRKALFCFPCLLLKKGTSVWSSNNGVSDLANLSNHISKHVKSISHVTASSAFQLLGKVRIDEALDSAIHIERQNHNSRVAKNRDFLRHHIKLTLYLGFQGLPFRGHDESPSSMNRGNFIEGLSLLNEFSGDERLQESLTSNDHRGKFTGISSDIQNDIISCIYSHYLRELSDRISKSNFISIMADDTTDIGNQCQLVLSVRYCYQSALCESMVDLIDVSSDRTAETLSDAIMSSLYSQVGIDENTLIVAQSYDGAPNMAGSNRSVQSILQMKWKYAYFSHCAAHKFALVVRQACRDIEEIDLFFGFLQNLTNFFRASPKRSSLIDYTLPSVGKTRWLSRGKVVKTVNRHLDSLKKILSDISMSGEFDGATKSEADGYVDKLNDENKLFLLKLFKRLFDLSDLLTFKLQSPAIDPVVVHSKMLDYKTNILSLRNDFAVADIREEVKSLSGSSGQTAKRIRKANSKYMLDSGYQARTDSDCIDENKRLMYEVIDRIVFHLDARFGDMARFEWVRLVHPTYFESLKKSDQSVVAKLIKQLDSLYPGVVKCRDTLKTQLHVLYSDELINIALTNSSGLVDCASLLREIHRQELNEALPEVTRILELVVTLPMTSVVCERNFSVLRRIKTHLRTANSETRLRSLMTLAVECAFIKNAASKSSFCDSIINSFAAMKERRIELQFK